MPCMMQRPETKLPPSLPHAQSHADGVVGVVAVRHGGLELDVLIAGEDDGVAAELVVEPEFGGQVALVHGDGAVRVDGVPDAGSADEVAPEGVARFQPHLPRQRAQ